MCNCSLWPSNVRVYVTQSLFTWNKCKLHHFWYQHTCTVCLEYVCSMCFQSTAQIESNMGVFCGQGHLHHRGKSLVVQNLSSLLCSVWHSLVHRKHPCRILSASKMGECTVHDLTSISYGDLDYCSLGQNPYHPYLVIIHRVGPKVWQC